MKSVAASPVPPPTAARRIWADFRFRRAVFVVLSLAAIAISDVALYLAGGTPYTYTWYILRAEVAYPVVPFLAGFGLAAFVLIDRLVQAWPILLILIGIVIGHLTWPVTIYHMR